MPHVLHFVACEIAATILCFQVSWNNLKPSFSFFCRSLILLFLFLQCSRLYSGACWCPLCRYSQRTVWQDSSLRVLLEDPHNRHRRIVLQHHPDAAFLSRIGFTAHPLYVVSINPSVLQERSLLGSDCINCLW